ncbi:MAG: alpha/beta fold hydrolase [Pseudonocardia sp.]
MLRCLIRDGVVPVEQTGPVVQTAFEFGGVALVERLLHAVGGGRGRRTWNWIAGLGAREVIDGVRYMMESDPVNVIAFRELGYGVEPAGRHLDPHAVFAEAARRYPPFTGEPFDLPSALAGFCWPTAVLSGARDVRTPRAVAERIVAAVPDAVLVAFPDLGHSVLDTHAMAALHVAHAMAAGTSHRLPGLAPRIADLPRRGRSRLIGPLISARLTLESALPRT